MITREDLTVHLLLDIYKQKNRQGTTWEGIVELLDIKVAPRTLCSMCSKAINHGDEIIANGGTLNMRRESTRERVPPVFLDHPLLGKPLVDLQFIREAEELELLV